MEFFAHLNFFLKILGWNKKTPVIVIFMMPNIEKSVNLTIMGLSFFQTGEFEVSAGEIIKAFIKWGPKNSAARKFFGPSYLVSPLLNIYATLYFKNLMLWLIWHLSFLRFTVQAVFVKFCPKIILPLCLENFIQLQNFCWARYSNMLSISLGYIQGLSLWIKKWTLICTLNYKRTPYFWTIL